MERETTASQEPDWQQIFREPVIEAEENTDGYANETWIVRTEKRSYVMKATLADPDPRPDRPFWDGIYTLFGMNVYIHMENRRSLADFVRSQSPLTVPQTVHIDLTGKIFPRPFIIEEKLSGEPADFEPETSPFDTAALARQLGEHLGRLHSADFNFWGSYPPPPSYALEDWPPILTASIDTLATRWFSEWPEVMADLPGFVAQARELPPLASAALILPDLHSGQFLVLDGQLSAIIDIEAHVLGPRELDFIALEYLLTPQLLPAFSEGYTRHLALPDLSPVRDVYRYLYWVMSALGEENYTKWMQQPALF